ncbi:MAG: TonB-dependent receptor [Thermoanaerobaculia bacterium]
MKRGQWFRSLLLAALAATAVTAPIRAQAQTGNVYGTVVDDKGQPLPGVTCTLTGATAPQVQISDAQGQVRFPGLSPATYKLEATLEGFSSVVFETVVVNVNRNTSLAVTMQPAIEETITVTAESPLLDTRKIQTGATVDKTELDRLPSGRDPWAILQTTPGVVLDRVNVGGNESGQQATYVGNGDDGRNSTWAVDGVEITDVGAIGSSPSYYDFGAFDEMQVATGGSDATLRTGGVGMNLVTKRGTNEWRGSGRYIYDNDSLQSDFAAKSGDFAAGGKWNLQHPQAAFKQGNRIQKVEDYGLELGGPLVKDRLWFWGSYGKNNIQLLTVFDYPDNTELRSWNVKLNGQIAANNTATFFYFNNDKFKFGRSASPTRPPETTWDQQDVHPDADFFKLPGHRPDVVKLEDTHIFGSTFFATGMYSEGDGGFQLTPEGGVGANHVNSALELSDLTWHNTFLDYRSIRPQQQYKVDGSYFFSTGGLNHELKFGANYRKASVDSLSRWPGFARDGVFQGQALYAYVYGDGVLNYDVKYRNLYAQDTLTAGNLTLNLGLRYDVQGGDQLAGVSQANPIVPQYMPEIRTAGGSPGFDDWKNLSPRLGLTYALGAEKKTLLRFSYSRFADQLAGAAVGQTYPIYPAPYIYFYADDRNHDGHVQPDEVGAPIGGSPLYNPFDPSHPLPTNGVDPDLKAPTTDELVLGVEHALMPEFVIGLNLTYREIKGYLTLDSLVYDGDPFSAANVRSFGRRAKAADYVQTATDAVTLPDGSVRNVPIYSLRPGVSSRGGTFLRNGEQTQTYKGVALTVNKRLSHNWMMRGNFSWSDWVWDVPQSEVLNPQELFTVGYAGGQKDGDRVVLCGLGGGAKSSVCVSSRWSYSLNGMYQVAPDRGWGFNVSAALNGHQGYALPYYIAARRGGYLNTSKINTLAVSRPDEFRLDDVHVLDLRLEKEFHFDRFGLTVGFDCFNALNSSSVLQRELRLSYDGARPADNNSRGDFVSEVLSPRVFRLGARFSFN